MLKKILSELKDAQAEASLSPELTDPRVQAGAFAIKRNAENRVAELSKEYKDAVWASIKVIAVSGKHGQEFAQLANQSTKTVIHDYLSPTKNLAAAIKNRTPRDTFSAQEYWMLLDELNKLKNKYEIEVLPAPQINTDDHNRNQDIDGAVTDLIERTMGNDLYAVLARKELSDLVFETKSQSDIIPVIVYNYKPTESMFLPQPVVSITVNDPVTPESVKTALSDIKNTLAGSLPAKPKRTKQTANATNQGS